MARGLIRTLLSLPCRRDQHTWVHPRGIWPASHYVCRDCGEPGFEV